MALPAVEIDDHDLDDDERGGEWDEELAANFDLDSRTRTGPDPEVVVDLDLFKQKCLQTGADRCKNQDLAEMFCCSVQRVERLKRQLDLTHLVARDDSYLPDFETFRERWVREDEEGALYRMPVGRGVATLATELNISPKKLRRHMSEINFSPKSPWTADELDTFVRGIVLSPWNNRVGVTFASTELRRLYGVNARPGDVRKALDRVSPERLKKKKIIYSKSSYRVGGPKSLYHLDAHEKLAKIWGMMSHIKFLCHFFFVSARCCTDDRHAISFPGIWIHGCIDRYSRFIIYLVATLNKFSEVVRGIFQTRCEEIGWSSRCRWDRGRVFCLLLYYDVVYVVVRSLCVHVLSEM